MVSEAGTRVQGTAKWTSLHTEEFQKEKSHRGRTLFKEMLTENFQTEERHRNSSPLDFITSLKSRGVWKQKQIEQSFIRLTRRFSTETLTWDGIIYSKYPVRNQTASPGYSILTKLFFRDGGKIRVFSDKGKQRKLSPLGLLLKRMLQGVPLKSVMWA